jgi:CDGSH-type Zn-finger protein
VPLRHEAAADGRVWFCGCKQSARAPLCDGSHKAL